VAASDFNSGALRFYERHGFVRVAALEGLVAEGRSEILLRKRL
jgi:ribosomal protein S18 acetylase RimI-like enzyme